MNNLVYQFYESDHVFGLFSYPHYIAFTTVEPYSLGALKDYMFETFESHGLEFLNLEVLEN